MVARLEWFGSFAEHTELFLMVAKPLLSMRTAGSMVVEQKVKPIKNTIMTKTCNRLKDPKGVALFRAQENLKYIMKAKKALGKRIIDSL